MHPQRILLWATALALLLAIPSGALASENQTMNESEFDTEPPQGDDSYLEDDEPWSEPASDGNTSDTTSSDTSTEGETATESETSSGNESTLSESEFDTSIPTYDESFLDVEWLEESESETASSEKAEKPAAPRNVPALAPLLAIFGAALVAATRRH